MPLPQATRWLVGWSRWNSGFWLFVIFSQFSILLFVYAVLRYIGSIRWDLPGMGRLMRRLHTATLLDAISLAAQRQRPLSDALLPLVLSYPKKWVRRRLSAVCDDMQAGVDDLESLRRHGLLGKSDLAVLQAAKRNGNFAWAARELADSNRRRFIYRTYALVQLLFPPVIIAYGLLVAAVAIALILPLATLIQSLTPP